jgi:hypothetical protein
MLVHLQGILLGVIFKFPVKDQLVNLFLPGENKKMIEGVYGQPGSQPIPRKVAGNDSPLGTLWQWVHAWSGT